MRCLPALTLLLVCSGAAAINAQSTYGTIVGTVKDSSGAAVANAAVTVTNIDENTARSINSNGSGDYSVPNLLAGHYKVDVSADSFQTFSATDLTLVARQLLRVDATLQVGSTRQTIAVNEEEAGIIQTDSQVVQATFNPEQLLNLPSNVRANGNTSPYRMLEVLPGVQADTSGNFGVQGALPSMTEVSVDGISTVDVTGNSPLTNAFPSQESIRPRISKGT
jgi:Carboxypeptidase regulatory-like domain